MLRSYVDNLGVLRTYGTLLLIFRRFSFSFPKISIVETPVILAVVGGTCGVFGSLPIVAVAAIATSGAIAVEAFDIQWLLPSAPLLVSR